MKKGISLSIFVFGAVFCVLLSSGFSGRAKAINMDIEIDGKNNPVVSKDIYINYRGEYVLGAGKQWSLPAITWAGQSASVTWSWEVSSVSIFDLNFIATLSYKDIFGTQHYQYLAATSGKKHSGDLYLSRRMVEASLFLTWTNTGTAVISFSYDVNFMYDNFKEFADYKKKEAEEFLREVKSLPRVSISDPSEQDIKSAEDSIQDGNKWYQMESYENAYASYETAVQYCYMAIKKKTKISGITSYEDYWEYFNTAIGQVIPTIERRSFSDSTAKEYAMKALQYYDTAQRANQTSQKMFYSALAVYYGQRALDLEAYSITIKKLEEGKKMVEQLLTILLFIIGALAIIFTILIFVVIYYRKKIKRLTPPQTPTKGA